jgi:cell wall-associated NlpC family hydrolase
MTKPATVKLTIVRALFNNMKHHVEYELGQKAPSLTCQSNAINWLDCSGFTQFVIARASEQKIILPEGSVEQHEWVAAHGWRKLDHYADVFYARDDPARLFIAFIAPAEGHGHVFLVNGGQTLESCGGHGVTSRHWDDEILQPHVSACYEVPT